MCVHACVHAGIRAGMHIHMHVNVCKIENVDLNSIFKFACIFVVVVVVQLELLQ